MLSNKKIKYINSLIFFIIIFVSPFSYSYFGNNFDEYVQGINYFNININSNYNDKIKEDYGVLSNYYDNNNNQIVKKDNQNRVSPTLIYPNDYKLEYKVIDKANNVHSKILNFTLIDKKPFLDLPLFFITNSNSFTLTGNYFNCNELNITLFDSSSPNSNIITLSSPIGTLNENINLNSPGTHKIKIIGKNSNSETFEIEREIIYDNQPPEILSEIFDGESFSGKFTNKVIINDNIELLNNNEYYFEIKNSSNNVILSGNKTSFSPIIYLFQPGSYSLSIEARDLAGNIARKTINFEILNNIKKVNLKIDGIDLNNKNYFTNKSNVNCSFSLESGISLSSLKLNNQQISYNNVNNDYNFTLTLSNGLNVLEIETADSSETGKTIYHIYKEENANNFNIANLNEVNDKIINLGNDNYISFQKVIFIKGNSDKGVFIDNKFLGNGSFGIFYVLKNGENLINIIARNREGGIVNNKTLNVTYTNLINDLSSLPNIPNVINANNLDFEFNATNSYSPFYIYLNGIFKLIALPDSNNKTSISGLSGFKDGLNYISIRNNERELYLKPIIYDSSTSNIELINNPNSILKNGTLVYEYDSETGLNTNTLNLKICSQQINSPHFLITPKYFIIKLKDNYFTCNSGNIELSIDSNNGNHLSLTSTFNIPQLNLLGVKEGNSEINLSKGILFLEEGDYSFMFNRDDFSVNSIKINDFNIYAYHYAQNNRKELIIHFNNDYLKNNYILELNLSFQGSPVIYKFKYYKKDYSNSTSKFYIQNYFLSDLLFRAYYFNNDLVNLKRLPNGIILGRYYIYKGDSTINIYDIKNDYETISGNIVKNDNDDLNINFPLNNMPYHVTKGILTFTLSNINSNVGNIVRISSINDKAYNFQTLDTSFNFVNPWSLLGLNLYGIKFLEMSNRITDKNVGIYYDFFKPKYVLNYTNNMLNLRVLEDNFDELNIYNATNDRVFSSNNKDVSVQLEEGIYRLEINDTVGNLLNETLLLYNNISNYRSNLFNFAGGTGTTSSNSPPFSITNIDCLNNGIILKILSSEEINSIDSCSLLTSNSNYLGNSRIFSYSFSCPNTLTNLNVHTPSNDYNFAITPNCNINSINLEVVLREIFGNVFNSNNIYITDSNTFSIKGSVNKDNVLIKVLIDNSEKSRMLISNNGNFQINNIDIEDLTNNRESASFNVKLVADKNGETAESDSVLLKWLKYLETAIQVIVY